jgi:MFS family permease
VLKKNGGLKSAFINGIIVANAFVWYLIISSFLNDILSQQKASQSEIVLVLGVNIGAIAVSALSASIAINKLKRHAYFLKLWLFVGIFVSLVPIGLGTVNMAYLVFCSIILGSYFGVGMPATMGYYSEHVKVENRGKTSGITFLIIALFYAIAGSIASGNIIITCVILSVIKIIGLVAFKFFMENDQQHEETQNLSFSNIIKYRPFVLYFAPWLMFSLINFMTVPIINKLFVNQSNFSFLTNVIESIFTAISAVSFGFLSDKLGRKRLIIIGFVMLGCGYAALGLLPQSYSIYFYIFSDGIAWGIFSVVFLLTIWGDIADNKISDKFYFAGVLPYIFLNFGSVLLEPYLSEIGSAAIFSFASVFLFLAVLPLVYAPETLPEKIMKNRDLTNYVGKALEKTKK